MKYYLLISERQPHTAVAKVRAANREVAYSIAYQNWYNDVRVKVAPGVHVEVCPVLEAHHKAATQLVVEVDKRSFDALTLPELLPTMTGYYVVNTETGEIVAYITTAENKLEAEKMMRYALEDGHIDDAEYTLESFDMDRRNTFEGLVWIRY